MSIVAELEAAGEVLSSAVRAAILALEARIAELEARLGQHSGNSSRPPSADPPSAPPRPSPVPRGGKRGAQKGHKGHHRSQVAAARVDHRVRHRPTACGRCGEDLAGAAIVGEPVIHQVAELPPVRAVVTEHQLLRVCCPHCRTHTRADLPAGVGHSHFGPRLTAFAALLTGRFRLSRRETCALLSDLLDVPPSLGSVQARVEETSQALLPAYREVRTAVRASAVANVDETGWRLRKQRRWMWTAVTASATLFRLGRRGSPDARLLLGRGYGGIVGSDRWGAYRQYPPEQRQLCWAHLKRDFQWLSEQKGEVGRLGRWGLRECGQLFQLWEQCKEGMITRKRMARLLVPVRWRLARLLKRGAELSGKARALCRDLTRLWPALWVWVHREDVQPTNNVAERALRKPVLWRKGSFGSNSGRGLRFVERILTVSETCRQRKRGMLDYLTRAIEAHRNGSLAPLLLAPL
ncbi:MAG TPA: IS66 family transposase [Longimicrobium sp.]|nr:IS66 family transposase [Longimicrobium sp.]